MSDPNQPAEPDGGVPPQQPGVPPQQPAGPPPGTAPGGYDAPPAGAPQQPYAGQQPYGAQQPYAGQQPYAAPVAAAPLDEASDKQWASFAHLGGILWLIPSLIIWLVFKDRGARTNIEAKEALNWQITWIIVWVASQIVGIILAFTGVGWLLFGLLIPWALYIVNLVFSILGFVKVNSGGSYRYPVNFRFIK